MTYAEAVARLLGLRGGEMAGMQPGLERIRSVLDALGNPERGYRIVQVGGTNGKGSVSAMLAAILRAAGWRTGLYTSPHLCSLRERIRVDGRAIPEADVADGVEGLGTLVARLGLTMFEAVTALALDHFDREGVELAVLEVGLGGRFDATTVGKPDLEILARIDLDHQAWLGHTLTEIAGEKAAIIRAGTALSARQEPEAEAVIRARAGAAGVPLLVEGQDLLLEVRQASMAGQQLDLAGPGWRLADVTCRLLGGFQAGNALLAAAAGQLLGAGEPAIRAGLARAVWPGRFQVLPGEPALVLDGAHNPGGARALAASLRAWFPEQPVTLVLGVSADKDAAGILAALAPVARRIILTAAAHPRAAAPERLRPLVPAGGTPAGVMLARGVEEALGLARMPPVSPVVCVAGSLFLVGEVLAREAGGTDPESLDALCRAGVGC